MLKSAYERLGGIVWIPRMLEKIRMNQRAELPDEYKPYFREGFDGRCVRLLRVLQTLYSGEIQSDLAPRHPAETMKDGFEYQGHEVLSDHSTAPIYIVKVDAYQNLLSKQAYIASVDWVSVEGK